MSPQTPSDLLQDTNNVHVTLVMSKNVRLLIVFFVITIFAIGLFRLIALVDRRPSTTESTAQAQQVSPAPKTQTFVDNLVGTILFTRGEDVYTLTLPDRKEQQLLGVRGQETVRSFPSIAPVWSQDGQYLAILDRPDAVTITEYDTGKYVGTYPLKTPISALERLTLRFDPFSEILAIGSMSTTPTGQTESVTFYAIATQKELGTHAQCSIDGVWIKNYGFSTSCRLATSTTLVLIQFEPSSSVMIPLTTPRPGSTYTLIDEYSEGTVLLLREQAGKKALVTLTMNGVITPLAQSRYPKIPQLSDLVSPHQALIRRIESQRKLSGIKDVSVASSDDWLVFERDGSLYVSPMDLQEEPFLLGSGSTPRIRPY